MGLILAVPNTTRGLRASPGSITLAITGDVALHRNHVDPRLPTLPMEKNPYRHMAVHLGGVDLAVTNFEGVIMRRDPRYAVPRLNLWVPPVWATAFRPAGVGLVTLANNHIMDGRHEGVLETVGYLRKQGLQTIGAGKDDAEARQPYLFRRGAACVGFLPATTILNKRERREARVAYYPMERQAELLGAVRTLAQRCSFVVVLLHFGRAGVHFPEGAKTRLARQVIEAGASLVAGGQPHVLQGVEYFQKGVIAYSLGNFIFPNALWSQRRTGLLMVELSAEARPRLRRLELIPALIERDTWAPRPLTSPSDQRQALDHMRSYCRPFGTRVTLANGRIRFAPPSASSQAPR
ncbi:MAG: CapA family protein [Polyangia bacterium]|nr:CapA family protein [Polyangia bacterium]